MENFEDLSEMELRDLLQKLEASEKTTFLDYKPHPKQLLFHLSPCYIRLFLGGNRSGKSRATITEDFWHLTGEYPDWFPVENRLTPPVYGRYIGKTYKEGIGEVLQPYIDELLPRSYVRRYQKTQLGVYSKLFFKNGSILDIMTDEQDVAAFEGWKGHFVHCDETLLLPFNFSLRNSLALN